LNLLLINPPGSKSGKAILDICEVLRQDYGWNVHASFLKDNIPIKKTDYFHSYDKWVSQNTEKIEATSIIDLERRYAQSALWTIIISQRTLYDYSYLSNAYPCYQPPISQAEFLLKSLVLFYSGIIEKYDIKTVFANAGDNMHSATLFCLANSMKFKAYFSNALLFDHRLYYLCDDPYFRSRLLKKKHKLFLQQYDAEVLANLSEINEFSKKLLGFNPVKEVKEIWRDVTIGAMIKSNIKFLRLYLSDRFKLSTGFENINPLKVLYLKSKSLLHRYYNYLISEYLIKYEKTIGDDPYVYLPLHLQPEATLLTTTPVFSDQLSLIRALSVSLPAGYKLAVKDYPIQAGYRPSSFYREIKKLPNVRLYHRLYPSMDLLDRCDAIATIQGSTGFEGILRGKKVLLFGKAIYEDINGVHSVKEYKDLNMVLKEVLFNPIETEIHDRSLNAYLRAFQQILYNPTDYLEYQNNDIQSAAHRLKTLLEMNAA